jgi:syntaxin 16
MTVDSISRDRTQEFFVLRRAAAQQRNWMAGPKKAAPTPVPSPDGPPPSWVSVVTHFREMEKSVTTRLDRLYAAQRDVFAPKFGGGLDADADAEKEIDTLAKEVQKFIKELERLVSSGVRLNDSENTDESKAALNVKKHLSSRLNVLLTAFRQAQQSYADQLTKRDEKKRKFRTFGDAGVHERLEKEEKVSGYLEMGYSQVEISELLLMDEQAKEQSDDIQEILVGIKELNEMFTDLRDMVVEQGTVLDRIDFNIEQASGKITKGVDELRKARELQKKCVVS